MILDPFICFSICRFAVRVLALYFSEANSPLARHILRFTMFESIVQSLLERHLGRFVKDLGKHDLKIGLLKGTDSWPLLFHWQPHTSLSNSCEPLF